MNEKISPPEPQPSDLDGFFLHSFSRQLREIGDWAGGRVYGAVRQLGHTGIRRAHELVVMPMRVSGRRMIDIARESGVSKNAIGQLADELETLGYLRRHQDKTDSRAKQLRFTDAGMALMLDAMKSERRLAAEIAVLIGTDKTETLKAIVEELALAIRADRGSRAV